MTVSAAMRRMQTPYLGIATARAGNVIGGGDWAYDRIVPDSIRALSAKKTLEVRNPSATRPWQHVLEPLSGYLLLAERITKSRHEDKKYHGAFNFGPNIEANRSVYELVEEVLKHWDGSWQNIADKSEPHEARRLHLQIDKVYHQLGWRPRWGFSKTVERTVNWYKAVEDGSLPLTKCLDDIHSYQATKI